MFIHATTDPEAALSALAILLAELHLHADTTQAVTHSKVAAHCLPGTREKQEQHECRDLLFFFFSFEATKGTEKYGKIQFKHVMLLTALQQKNNLSTLTYHPRHCTSLIFL